MKNISIRSTPVLLVLGSIALGLLFMVEKTQHEQQEKNYEEKFAAAKLTAQCREFLKQKHFANEVSLDNINDPNDTKIVGSRYSSITSGRGSLPVKLGTVNPNFSALIVQLFHDAGLKKGDHIVIGATGSFPGLNIAASAAAEVMDLQVTYLASVTSSSWGANDPEYTYLDMQSSLQKGGLISFKADASSIGANQDVGRGISPEGREDALRAIDRNEVRTINGKTLEDNIQSRLAMVEQKASTRGEVKLYMNIGGGVASLGGAANSETLPSGLLSNVKLDAFEEKTGMMFEMARKGVPLINLKNLSSLMKKHELPVDPVPLPVVGEGKLFKAERYDMMYVYGAGILLLGLLSIVIAFDRKQNKLGSAVVDTTK